MNKSSLPELPANMSKKVGVKGEAMVCLLHLLTLDLENYRRSPLSAPNQDLIHKAEDLLAQTKP